MRSEASNSYTTNKFQNETLPAKGNKLICIQYEHAKKMISKETFSEITKTP